MPINILILFSEALVFWRGGLHFTGEIFEGSLTAGSVYDLIKEGHDRAIKQIWIKIPNWRDSTCWYQEGEKIYG